HNRGSSNRHHARGELVNSDGGGARGRRLLLQAREIQQMVIGRPLLSIAKAFVGAGDLPEFQRGIGIARMEAGVNALDVFTASSPETFSLIVRKSPEQIVKRLQCRFDAGFPRLR